ncbi:MAG TPA: lipoprotein insertase outer membrane protein LolB [Steroidobacteraceae bacterium]|nr:lipoprotein insertase outer membrane protein LolB [Steroidobacteraceae bacterium]
MSAGRRGAAGAGPRAVAPALALCTLALCTVLYVAGCATRPPVVASLPWPVRRGELQARSHFELSGRVAVAADGQGFNGRLRWDQQGPRTQLNLDGPLGVGGVRVVLEDGRLSLTGADGTRLDSDAARDELMARLGFEPPLASLRYWIQGVPDPGSPAVETPDALPRLAALSQEGWTIDYTGYQAVAGQWLPQRISLQRGTVRVRLVIDSWRGS